MILCRLIETFETYLSEIIRETLHSRPDMLKSQDLVKMEYVLQFESIDDLRADLIDRKVSELTYQGFSNLNNWFETRMGISPVVDNDLKYVVVEMIETRNIIVHNRARIGNKYLKNVSNPQYKVGDIRNIDSDYVIKTFVILSSITSSLDQQISSKFTLPVLSSSESLKPFEKS